MIKNDQDETIIKKSQQLNFVKFTEVIYLGVPKLDFGKFFYEIIQFSKSSIFKYTLFPFKTETLLL